MAASSRLFIKVHNGFPEHAKTAELSDKAFRHLIELWCFCSRNLNDGILTESQLSKQLSKKTRQELVAAGFIDETPEGARMHDYLDHQQSAQQVADLQERRAEAGSRGGKAKANRVASARAVAKQTASKPLADTDTDTDTDVSASAETVPTARQDVARLCDHLADLIAADGSKRPAVTKAWEDAARLMLDKDGLSEEEIHAAIAWCQAHHFWRTNILSMPKLREKFDQLRKVAAAERQGGGSRRQEGTNGMFERAAVRLGVVGES